MSNIQRNELMLLQNDILGDIKKAENKLDTKIFKVSSSLDELKEKFEDKINHLEKDFKILLQKNETLKGNDSNEDKIYSKINLLTKRVEDNFSRLDSKIIMLQNELKDSCYKFDKALTNNFQIPGLIGERCPFSSLRNFLENSYKKINESLRMKNQQNIDIKKYKEKLEGIILKNKN